MAKKSFYTDGMTVEEILNLGIDVLNSLDKRDMSHALRTVSLAANKRLNNLLDNSILRHGQYIEKKSAKRAIATDALNKLYDEAGQSSKAMRFSVGNKTRNEMYAELSRVRDFMNLKTSTVAGAEAVRKTRESRTFGKTREDISRQAAADYTREYRKRTGKAPNKRSTAKVIKEAIENFEATNKAIWSSYRKWQELNNKQGKFDGSDGVIEAIAQRTLAGDNEADILEKASAAYEEQYELSQDELREAEADFWADNDELYLEDF